MEEPQVWERLGAVFAEVFGEELALARETTAKDVYGWDSVRNIELMVAVERAFTLRFTTAEIAGLENVGALVDLIARRSG